MHTHVQWATFINLWVKWSEARPNWGITPDPYKFLQIFNSDFLLIPMCASINANHPYITGRVHATAALRFVTLRKQHLKRFGKVHRAERAKCSWTGQKAKKQKTKNNHISPRQKLKSFLTRVYENIKYFFILSGAVTAPEKGKKNGEKLPRWIPRQTKSKGNVWHNGVGSGGWGGGG